MAKLSQGDVLKLARLSRISLTDDEAEGLAAELAEILKYVEQLQGADDTGLKPTNQVTGLVNVMRADEVVDYGYRAEELLKNVPAVEKNQIKVKRMIG